MANDDGSFYQDLRTHTQKDTDAPLYGKWQETSTDGGHVSRGIYTDQLGVRWDVLRVFLGPSQWHFAGAVIDAPPQSIAREKQLGKETIYGHPAGLTLIASPTFDGGAGDEQLRSALVAIDQQALAWRQKKGDLRRSSPLVLVGLGWLAYEMLKD